MLQSSLINVFQGLLMKTLTPLCFTLSLLLLQSTAYGEGLYKWKDARGNIQYGDSPPANSNAQSMELPKITIIDNYADQWKPMNFKNQPAEPEPEPSEEPAKVIKSQYTKLAFLAPKPNQAIRANDGDVTAMISIKPPLKKGHQLVFSIDGKSMTKTKARTKNFSDLKRGKHTIAVSVVDKKGRTLKNQSVSFNVLRASQLNSEQANQAKKLGQTMTFKEARQKQINAGN